MNTARLDRLADGIRNKAKPCPLCRELAVALWEDHYTGLTIRCAAMDCGCRVERSSVTQSPETLFADLLKIWNRRD